MRTHVTLLAAAAVLTAGCAATPSQQSALAEARVVSAALPAPDVQNVLLISVDALNPRALTLLGPTKTAALHRLMAQGASTRNARTLYERTETLPNHTSMLTGRRVWLPRGTGVGFNSDNGSTLAGTAGHYVASVFDVVHDNGGSTAMYVAKDKFRFLDRSWDGLNGAPDLVGADNGRDKVDEFVLAVDDEPTLVKRLRAELVAAPRTFTFLHLAAPDRAGHAYGGMSGRYLAAVRQTDALVRALLDTIESTPALRQHLLVVLTSDHGTHAYHHSAAGRLANYRIPLMAWGPGVARGANLYTLNPELLRPGRGRPGYDGPQPVRNGDVANLVTQQLGLPPVAGSELNRPRTLGLR